MTDPITICTGPRVYASKADYYADMLDRLVRDLSESVEQKVWEIRFIWEITFILTIRLSSFSFPLIFFITTVSTFHAQKELVSALQNLITEQKRQQRRLKNVAPRLVQAYSPGR